MILYPLQRVPFLVLSLLPFPLLYVLSDMTALVLEYVIRYRRKVVESNLRLAFPEKSAAEISSLRHGFYRNLSDVFLETLKLLTMDKEELKRRVVLKNPEAVEQMQKDPGGGIGVFGHLANWEWLGASMALLLPFPTAGIYRPLSSAFFDRLMMDIRTRTGNRMVADRNAYRDCLQHLKTKCYYGFLSDQNPSRSESMFFTHFFGKPAPFHLGPARIAFRTGCPFWYSEIQRVGRGRYEVILRKVEFTNSGSEEQDIFRLTHLHAGLLEQGIRRNPSDWLWSHRRWKHSPGEKDRVFSER